jgi:hypothetical protein
MNIATNRKSTPAVDAFTLVVRRLMSDHTGIILVHDEARVSVDADGVYTIGKGPNGHSRQQMDSVIAHTWGVEEAARSYMEHFPSNVEFIVSSEVSRLRYKAEGVTRDIAAAKSAAAWSGRMTSALNAAMIAAGCVCKVLLAPHEDQSSGYGDRDGVMVYCDSEAGAVRVAQWICKWESRDYEARGGKYGAGYGQAQSSYDVRECRTVPAGVPFAAFASFRYYSRGD